MVGKGIGSYINNTLECDFENDAFQFRMGGKVRKGRNMHIGFRLTP